MYTVIVLKKKNYVYSDQLIFLFKYNRFGPVCAIVIWISIWKLLLVLMRLYGFQIFFFLIYTTLCYCDMDFIYMII